MVSLLVRLWVEIIMFLPPYYMDYCQPPCEAVSWNEIKVNEINGDYLSASLWGCELKFPVELADLHQLGQPPCEAVSWNCVDLRNLPGSQMSASLWGCELKWCTLKIANLIPASASLWGCELKCHHTGSTGSVSLVSLLVRLWVEIFLVSIPFSFLIVSLLVRLWVEILTSFFKYLVHGVSLLVRLWVEMHRTDIAAEDGRSASLWGCELKLKYDQRFSDVCTGQPPCEAVSWNTNSLWSWLQPVGQPPCEAVSWNTIGAVLGSTVSCQPPCEAVSWNACADKIHSWYCGQPPCEAVSWNIAKDITMS